MKICQELTSWISKESCHTQPTWNLACKWAHKRAHKRWFKRDCKWTCKRTCKWACKLACKWVHKIACYWAHKWAYKRAHKWACKKLIRACKWANKTAWKWIQKWSHKRAHKWAHKRAQTGNCIIESDWLFPHDPIPKAKFQPITALLKISTYHKSAKGFPPPCPQISLDTPNQWIGWL